MIYLEIKDDLKSAYKDYVLNKNYQQNLYFKQRIDKSFKEKFEKVKKYKRGDLKNILQYIYDNLEDFIIGDLDKLKKLQNDIETKFPKFIKRMNKFLKDRKSKKKKVKLKEYEIIYDLFIEKGYEAIVSNKMAYEFIKALDVKVCPYCNINYISYVGNTENKGVRPALEHFYPKEKYPWFAINLYNLVPICEACNSLKSNKFPIGLKNVYQLSKNNDEFIFDVIYDLIERNMSLEEVENSIQQVIFLKEVNENNKIFKLYERYQFHKDVISEILWKKISKPDVLLKSFENLDIDISENEAYRIIHCNYFEDKDFKKRPLSKLTYDIFKRQDLII